MIGCEAPLRLLPKILTGRQICPGWRSSGQTGLKRFSFFSQIALLPPICDVDPNSALISTGPSRKFNFSSSERPIARPEL